MSKLKKVANVVKKVVSSPIGKIALAAAAVYTGGAALGAWGAGSAAAAGGAAASAGGVAASAGSAGGFFSSVSTGLKALSAVNSIGGMLGGSSESFNQNVNQQGGTTSTPETDAAGLTAEAAAAAEEERKRMRKGAAGNTLTSPLGLSSTGGTAANLLLG